MPNTQPIEKIEITYKSTRPRIDSTENPAPAWCKRTKRSHPVLNIPLNLRMIVTTCFQINEFMSYSVTMHREGGSVAQNTVIKGMNRTGKDFSLPASFDFATAREFLRHFKAIHLEYLPQKIRISLRHTHYIDTAGLGALLLLGEHVGRNREIMLNEAHGEVRDLLLIARIQERLSGTLESKDFDLRACAQCGHTANGRCRGSLHEINHCTGARPAPRRQTPNHDQAPRLACAHSVQADLRE
jgi:anti-anti-sigma regulatory factor